MYLQRRKIPRTEGPQPVYKSAVDATVRTWMPAAAVLLACVVTPQRARLDVRAYEWGQSVTWVPPVVDAVVRQRQPAATTELASFRTAERPKLDVRYGVWSDAGWLFTSLTPAPTTAQIWPAIQLGTGRSYSTPGRQPLNVRRYEWATSFGLSSVVDATVRSWIPAAGGELASTRTSPRRLLDVRAYEWAPDEAWLFSVQPVSASVAQTWPAMAAALGSFRTPAPRSTYDARLSADGGSFGVPLDQSEAWQPAIDAQRSDVTAARARLDVRRYDWAPQPGWVFSALTPAASVAQRWPAVLLGAGLSYRTEARPRLDVRGYEWATTFGLPAQIDVAVRSWMPAIAGGELASARTRDGARLEVRSFGWSPDSAWLFTAQPPPVPIAQTWPAVWLGTGTQYQTPKRPILDVRSYDWSSTFGITQVVDATVRAWSPIFVRDSADRRPVGGVRREDYVSPVWLASYLGAQQSPAFIRPGEWVRASRVALDVRGYDWMPSTAWLSATLTPVVSVAQQWPAVLLGLSPSYRTTDHAPLDVRGQDWTPAFDWVAPVVDVVVTPWASSFSQELATFRTNSGPVLDLRGLEWFPILGWLQTAVDGAYVPPSSVIALPAHSSAVTYLEARSSAITTLPARF